jgi:hypothetical protein
MGHVQDGRPVPLGPISVLPVLQALTKAALLARVENTRHSRTKIHATRTPPAQQVNILALWARLQVIRHVLIVVAVPTLLLTTKVDAQAGPRVMQANIFPRLVLLVRIASAQTVMDQLVIPQVLT